MTPLKTETEDAVAELVREVVEATGGDLARAVEVLADMVVRAHAAISVGYVRGRI